MPHAVERRPAAVAWKPRTHSCVSPWRPARSLLRWLLLGIDVPDVRRRDRERRLDARPGRRDGSREEPAPGPQAERAAGLRFTPVGWPDYPEPFLVLAILLGSGCLY